MQEPKWSCVFLPAPHIWQLALPGYCGDSPPRRRLEPVQTASSCHPALRRWQRMVGDFMITVRENTVWGIRVAIWGLLCVLQASTAATLDARPAKTTMAERIARSAHVMGRVGSHKDREKVPDAPI